jgi:Flp pilus assembly protein TadD
VLIIDSCSSANICLSSLYLDVGKSAVGQPSSRCRCLCLLVLLTAFAVPASADEAQWTEVRSDHVTVITDAGEKDGRHVRDRFEEMRTAFGLLFGRASINQPVPLEIVAFRNTKEMRQYSPTFNGKVVELSGFFQQAEDKDFIVVDMSREDSWQTVFHEYAHVLLNSNFQPTAPWFDEGFAEYLSSMKVTPGNIIVGQTIPEAAFLMQGNTPLHLLELFQVQHHSETYNVTGSRREMFYVESWLVVHYLFDKRLIPLTSKYFHLTNDQHMAVPEAVQSAFGMSIAELEKQILGYLRGGKVQVASYSSKEKFSLSYTATARPLTPLETRAELADLHLHSEDHVSLAIREFQEVLQADPNQAEAQRGLGYAYLRNHDLQHAGEHFRAAANLGSKDARVYYYSAVLLLQGDPGAMTSPQLMQDVRRAIALDPDYADAYALLGEALTSTGKGAEGEQSLRHAMELSPRNQMYRLNFALALMNQQKIDDAESLLNSVANSSDPVAAADAQQALRKIAEFRTQMARPDAEVTPHDVASEDAAPSAPEASAVTNSPAAKYLQGTIVSVDCSAAPAAVLTVTAGGQTWKMKVANTEHVIVIGADFSCSWSKKKVGLNYRPTGDGEGSVISVEIQ